MIRNTGNTRCDNSIVGQITYKLDLMDKVHDNKISKNIWDNFWKQNDPNGNFKGKKEADVGDDGISVSEAKKLIMTRLFNAFNKFGKSKNLNIIGNEWLKKANELTEKTNTSEKGKNKDITKDKTLLDTAVTSSSKQSQQTLSNTKPVVTSPDEMTKDKEKALDQVQNLTKTPKDDLVKVLQEKSSYRQEASESTRTLEPDVTDKHNTNLGPQFTKKIALMAKELNVVKLIRQEMVKRGIKEKDIDLAYWKDKITRVSYQFNIPEEIIVSIISRETAFTKTRAGGNGHGAMQLTTAAINDLFPGAKGSRYDLYQQLDRDLLEEVLYKKDKNGNVIVKDGKPVLKYANSKELLRACGKDDELSIKVGALIFEMTYVNAVSIKKGKGIQTTISELKSGRLVLDEKTNKDAVSLAVRNYNGNKKRNKHGVQIRDAYRTDVMDSLRIQGFEFKEPIIKKA